MARSWRDELKRQSQCEGKQPLKRDVAIRIQHQSERKVVAYRCGYCEHWHVGSQLRPLKNKPSRN